MRRLPRIFIPLLFGLASCVVFFVNEFVRIPYATSLFVASLLLLGYLILEINYLRRAHPDRWLLNPVVLCSIGTLGISYGLTNAVFMLPYSDIVELGWTPGITESMARLVWLSLLATIALWTGYWSKYPARLSRQPLAAKLRRKLLPRSNQLRKFALPALVVVSLLSRLIQIKLGVFGYSGSYDKFIENSSITQYLSLASGLGVLALVLAAVQFYLRPGSIGIKKWFYGLFLLELAFGFLSGFKSAVVMPIVVVAASKYLVTARVPKKWLLAVPLGILVAYAVIEPFRAERNEGVQFSGTSVDGIVTAMVGGNKHQKNQDMDTAGTGVSMIGRSNLTYAGSFGIEFSDANPVLPDGSPEFLKNIYMAPAYALIPRALWPTKPTGTLGLWYNQVVMGNWNYSSTAMGPITYLYLSGGVIAIVVGFFLLGTIQRFLFFVLAPSKSVAGGVVLLAMLGSIGTISSNFDSVVIALFRDLPLVVVLQHLLFRSRAQNESQDTDGRLRALRKHDMGGS